MSADPKRIAVFRLGHIGDTIIALPALWTVRKRFPDAHILYLTQEHDAKNLSQGSEVLRIGTVFDEVFSYKLGSGGVSKLDILKTLLKLRAKRIDMLAYLPPHRSPQQLVRDEKFFRLAGIKQIVGMTGYRETDYRPKGSPLPFVTNEADILLKHLARDGVTTNDDPQTLMHMGLSEDERATAAAWVKAHFADPSLPIIGLGPGSKMTSKLWPIERYIGVAKALDQQQKLNFLAFGGPGEKEICERICSEVSNAVNAAGLLSIRQSAAVFEHCCIYLGNDTGTMHIAASSGVPCVALFSARDWPGRWFPYGKDHIVHRFATPCEGCMLETCDRGNECLMAISAETVLESTQKLLATRISMGAIRVAGRL